MNPIEDGLVDGAAGGDGEVFRNLVAAGVSQANDGAEVTIKGRADRERDLHVFAHDAVGRCRNGDKLEVREASLGPEGNGEDGDVAEAIFLSGGDGWLPLVPIAVAEKNDRAEVRAVFEKVGEGGFKIRAGLDARLGVFRRSAEGLDIDGGLLVFKKGEIELGGENFLRQHGARNDIRAGALGIVSGIDGHHGAGVVG